MAGLVSGPKAPKAPRVVYVPQTPVVTSTSNVTDTSSQETVDTDDSQTTSQEDRAAEILSAQRGRLSTVRTGYRGILDEDDNQPQRKTLMGQ